MRRVGLLIVFILVAVSLKSGLPQRINLWWVLQHGDAGRLAAHRVNDKLKLGKLVDAGVRSFELDLLFRPTDQGGWFEVAHDESEATGVALSQYLNWLPADTIKLWLDIKNLDPKNTAPALKHLQALDLQYPLKRRALIETSLVNGVTQAVALADFHSVYYAPVGKVLALAAGDLFERQKLAEQIVEAVAAGGFKGVSFSRDCYSFMQEFVLPKLPGDFTVHLWGDFKLYKMLTIAEIVSSAEYRDPHVKTLLYTVR